MKTADQMAANYGTAMSSAQTKTNYQNGINAVTNSPMQAAANANDLYLANVQASVTSGRRTAALLAVPLSTWKTNASGVGADRLASGATKSKAKVAQFFQKMAPVYSQIQSTVAQMPKGTEDAAIERVRTTMRMLKQAVGKS